MNLPAHYDQQGLKAEIAVKRWLQLTGYAVRESTRTENIQDDIDCWVRGRQFTNWHSISIKAMTAGISYGQVGFEIETDRSKDRQGWFQSGKADYYLIVRDRCFLSQWQPIQTDAKPYPPRLYWLHRQSLHSWVEANGWHHTASLSPALLRQQRGLNTTSGYLLCKDLLSWDRVEMLPADWYDMVVRA